MEILYEILYVCSSKCEKKFKKVATDKSSRIIVGQYRLKELMEEEDRKTSWNRNKES